MSETTKKCAKCGGAVTSATAGVWVDMPMFDAELPVFCAPCWKQEIKVAKIPEAQGSLNFGEVGI